MKRLKEVLRDGAARGDRTLILCDNEGQIQRLEEILGGQTRLPAGAQLAVGALDGGFILNDSAPRLRVLTDHEIFLRTRRIRRRRRFRGSASLDSVAQLTPGDAVVHMDHGIGRFRGLEHVTIGGEELESILIEYAGAEFLRVPVYRLDLLERWVGGTEGAEPPPVHRIGGKRWKNLRARTEQAIRKVATELLELYARREMAQGHAFAPDTRWQKEMESSFLYEDTRDQRRVVEDIKRDMEAAAPMDRLVCGDVGIRQDRGGDSRRLQGGPGRQAGRRARPHHRAGRAARAHLRRASRRLPGDHRGAQPVPQREGDHPPAARDPPRDPRYRHRHPPPALERRRLPQPRSPRRRRRAALRSPPQGAAQAAAGLGRRAHPHGDAHSAYPSAFPCRPAQPVADPDSAPRPRPHHHPRHPLERPYPVRRPLAGARPGRPGLLPPQPRSDHPQHGREGARAGARRGRRRRPRPDGRPAARPGDARFRQR